jgi:serine phosphatase RsbU (regulator of sigma subunit)
MTSQPISDEGEKAAMTLSKVLVVEDHPVSRKMLEAMLRKNYQVISASSGKDAISLAESAKPDLVLLDIEMPEMDGFQTLEILRRGVIDHAVPVIFLTAREDAESRDRGLEIGAVDYLIKPYDKQELSIKVKNHLALYEARKEIEAKNRIMAREMEMASQLQNALLPDVFPSDELLDYAVIYRPVSQAGGDFYDLIQLPDSSIGFAQVDVSGHGVASAMIGAMFKMVFHSVSMRTNSPSGVLGALNDQLFEVLPDTDFLTVFYGVINTGSLEFAFSNAGHPLPFLYRAATGEVEELTDGGPLIGAFPGMQYDEGFTRLRQGDKILVFTDGVTETSRFGDSQDLYGSDRLKQVFLNHIHEPCADILSNIMADLEAFGGASEFADDISMLLISIKKERID